MGMITLAPMPTGNRMGKLGVKHTDYIDKYHTYETIGTMARELNVNEGLVFNYCHQQGYTTPKSSRKKPDEKKRTDIFDVNTYSRTNWTI